MPKQRRQIPQTQTLTFVVEAPPEKPGKDNQKLIRSHAARVNRSRDDNKNFKSWMLRKKGTYTALQIPDGSIPGRVGSNLSLLDFPEPLQPYMENDIFRFDQVYFHSVIFSAEAYFDMILGREQGSLSQFHFLKTIRLLQERLNNPRDPKAISDATIMVVVVLGLVAELIGDRAAAESHAADFQLKCAGKVDLGFALRFGSKPVFFNDGISWNPYVSSKGLIRGMKKAAKRNGVIGAFIKTLDPRLSNVWKDLDEFATLSNLASQTGLKLQPNTFSEIMVSIFYRLLTLSYPESPLANALRLATYCCAFMALGTLEDY
ncbi:hypothetical protein FGRMN_2598 [Fusarium graminum]|nr:hypothetical protein FGRMN_2598 [Fusarium graminum]